MNPKHAAILDRFNAACRDVRKTQHEVLMRMIFEARGGAFGREHGFDTIKNADDFRRQVPLANYEDLRKWIERDVTAMIGERPMALLRTSSSTGKPKVVPFGQGSRRATRAGYEVYTAAMFRDHPELARDPGQPPAGIGLYQRSGEEEGGVDGVPYDTYITRLIEVANEAMPEDPFFNCFAEPIFHLVDATDRLYAMAMQAAPWSHLRAVRATNPTTLLLFGRVLAEQTDAIIRGLEAGKSARPGAAEALGPVLQPQPELARRLAALNRPLRARDLWPELNLAITWRGGACEKFIPFIKEAFGDVHVRSLILAATEGMIALPLDYHARAGTLAIESTFFEFRPADYEGPDTLLAHELEVGKRYELILTSPSGMWRYTINDLVDVEGMHEATPCINFIARKGRTSSLTGEKLTELQVEEAMAAAEQKAGLRARHYVLSPQFGTVPWYVLSVEWSEAPSDRGAPARFAEAFEAELQKGNIEYRYKRDTRRLDAVAIYEVAAGEFERIFAEGSSKRLQNQFKLPHLTSEPMHEKFKQSARGG